MQWELYSPACCRFTVDYWLNMNIAEPESRRWNKVYIRKLELHEVVEVDAWTSSTGAYYDGVLLQILC